MADAATADLTFVGTATTLLRLGDFTLLTDPNFLHRGQRAHIGYGMWTRRRTEPAAQPADLPRPDAVLLSHLHGDHFDRIARRELPKDLPVITTPHAATRLRRWGFDAAAGLRTWTTTELTSGSQRLTVTSVPGVHAPGPINLLFPPVMGSVLDYQSPGVPPLRLYITGDTLYRPQLAEIIDTCGPLDAMIIHLGGTKVLGLLVTMDGRQGADLVELLRPSVTVPVHYDDYPRFRSPLSDFLSEARRRPSPGEVRTVQRGQTVSLRPAHHAGFTRPGAGTAPHPASHAGSGQGRQTR
jgi:L-ascorbate metabolism protein UlaG (beta-lactamase superfamily)